jgi:hypothetical protein
MKLDEIIEKMKNSFIWKKANEMNSLSFQKWHNKEFILNLEKAQQEQEEIIKVLMSAVNNESCSSQGTSRVDCYLHGKKKCEISEHKEFIERLLKDYGVK